MTQPFEIKLKVLELLEKNCKLNSNDLGDMLGVTPVEIDQAIKELEDERVICGYKALVDWDKVAQDKVTALIEVKVTPQKEMGFGSLAEAIYNYPEVEAVYLMSGAFDFTVIIKGNTLREVAKFVSDKLSTLENVLSTSTHFVLERYKDQGTILKKQRKAERLVVTP